MALKWLPGAMCFTDKPIAAEADEGDDAQGDLADLIDGNEIEAETDDGDAGGDDLASLIGDAPEAGEDGDQQDGSDVGAEAQHDNDDAVEPEMVAAE